MSSTKMKVINKETIGEVICGNGSHAGILIVRDNQVFWNPKDHGNYEYGIDFIEELLENMKRIKDIQ
jgi:hypothetical protein